MSQLTNDKNIKILDGGMGRELKNIGAPFQQPEWSALTLIEAPEFVAQAHQNFINAGANIITTNAYALVPFHIGEQRFHEHAYDLAHLAARIAKQCALNTAQVAGCIPPAFGSYKPENFIKEDAHRILTPLVQAQSPFVDFWLVETISSILEAETVINIIREHSDKPLWLSFTLNNRDDFSKPPTLRSGELLNEIYPLLKNIDAILFNCSQPEEMKDAISTIRALDENIDIGAYANSFSEVKRTHNANEGLSDTRNDITPQKYLDFAKSWVHAGATIIGGCCGIGPEHIKAIADYYRN